MRLLTGTGLILFLFIVIVILFMRQSLAPLDGTLKLSGLTQKVTVTRDAQGIPHIKAENKKDALRALGFVAASERLFQMEIQRRLVYGRLSELFGEVALPTDKLYRSLMLKRATERMLAHKKQKNEFDEKSWSEMEAYFAGVNEYLQTQTLPFEFTLLGFKPEPFTPLDAYVMAGHMAYSFGIAIKADPLMTKLAKKLPQELFQSLRMDLQKTPYKISDLGKALLPDIDYFQNPQFEGSNAWLISGSRSASGKSLFANDPHISFANPAVWFEAHMHTPEFELYGHHLPLIPFAIIGHSRHLAWGFTMLLVDDMDIYREKIDTTKKTVIFRKKEQPYVEWTEVLKIKDRPDEILTMIETPHGPLLNHILEDSTLSLKWAFHDPESDTLSALRQLGDAKEIKAFESALKSVAAPGLNVMYADPENIAWWTLGRIAVKKNPNSDLILDGASGDDEYLEKLAWEKKPHLINPPEGVIVTANSRSALLPENIRGDWQPDDRFVTITEILAEQHQWSAEEFKKIQTLNFNSTNLKIRDILVANLAHELKARHKDLVENLIKWDGHSEIHSREAALFHLWNTKITQQLLKNLSPEDREAYFGTPAPWTFYKRSIFDKNSPWWPSEGSETLISQAFADVVRQHHPLPAWGDIHTVEYIHPLGRKKPLNVLFNAGPYPVGGSYNDINNNKHGSFGSDKFIVTGGASTRRIIDMAHPEKSWGINPLGVSGHLLSPYARNEVQMFLDGHYRAQLMDEKDIQAVKTHELILTP